MNFYYYFVNNEPLLQVLSRPTHMVLKLPITLSVDAPSRAPFVKNN